MSHVFDASAVLALLGSEKGAAKAAALMPGSFLSSVNAVEVQQKLIDAGFEAEEAAALLESLGLTIEPFTTEQAAFAAALRPLARLHRLSLADRACIALAKVKGLPALSGDRSWKALAKEAGFAFEDVRR